MLKVFYGNPMGWNDDRSMWDCCLVCARPLGRGSRARVNVDIGSNEILTPTEASAREGTTDLTDEGRIGAECARRPEIQSYIIP